MVILDIKGVKHRINKKDEQTYRYQIAISKENLEKLNINPNKITNKKFKPVKVLDITEFENLQKKESIERQKAVAILNQKIESKDKQLLELTKQLQNKDNKSSLKLKEYEALKNQIKNYKKAIATQDEELGKLKEIEHKVKDRDKAIATLEKTIKELKDENNELNLSEKDNQRLIQENTKLYKENNNIKKELASEYQKKIDELKNQVFKLETINESKVSELKNVEKIYQKQHQQLEDKYDQLNDDNKKCISLNSSLITDFKHLLGLGFFDLLKNKHKKMIEIAIKKEFPEKPLYELIKKE